MNVVLIGFKASGKSTVGRLLAERLNLEFVDLDAVFEHLFYERYAIRCSYREPYEHYGEELFRRVEHDALTRVAGRTDMLLATGGGAPMPEVNRPILLRIGTVIYLQVSPEVIYGRLQANGMPAYLQDDPSPERLRQLWDDRHGVYAALADMTVDVSDCSPEAAAEIVAQRVTAH